MKLKTTIPIMVSTAAFLAACGGGGGSTIKSPQQYKLSGTVPGTVIEAFCDNGSYHSVNSQGNGTDRHPFALTLPSHVSCRVLMTTNEDSLTDKVVTPIRIRRSQGVSGIAFKSNGDLDLGHIDLALARSEMRSDINGDGVEDEPHEIELEESDSAEVEIRVASYDPLDDDGDGIINVYEDDDDDRIPNKDDDDDDGDGLHDDEDDDHDNDGESDNDLDRDGIENGEDEDQDNDGIEDDEDRDDDNDGVEDDEDSDDDNDGKEDEEDEDHDEEDDNDQPNSNPTVQSAGRLLAAQCWQCHGTEGSSKTGIDSLAGESRNEIIEEMLEMKNDDDNEVMHLQAKGYTAEQIELIADYISNNGGRE